MVATQTTIEASGYTHPAHMNVLVACEESQRVCLAFRERGHNAFSCDILPCSGGHPGWHIRRNVLDILQPQDHGNNCLEVWFNTEAGEMHFISRWDLVIAFPPCTNLCSSGARWFKQKQKDGRQQESIDFFLLFTKLDCKWAIENPIGIMSRIYRKPDQIIQPYYFGDPYNKSTCLWVSDELPLLVPTNIVSPGVKDKYGFSENFSLRYAVDEHGKILSWGDPRTKIARSKTPIGLANAMAEQWG